MSSGQSARLRANRLANAILVCGVLCCVAALGYALFRSRYWEPGAMRRYYAAIITIGLAGCAARKLRPDLKINFVIVGVSALFTTYALQVLFMSSDYMDGVAKYGRRFRVAKRMGMPFDARTRLEVIQGLIKKGEDPVPCMSPMLFARSDDHTSQRADVYTFGGVSKRLTVASNEGGEWTIYWSDEYGFNNPPGVFGADRTSIAIVGDSFAHGFCVQPEEALASKLRRPGRNVMNLGCPEAGPLAVLGVLKEYAQSAKPRIVLWLYFEGNDLTNLAKEAEIPLLLKYLEKGFSQQLPLRQKEVDRLLAEHVEREMQVEIGLQRGAIGKAATLWHIRSLLGVFVIPHSPPPPSSAMMDLFGRIMAEARDVTASWGGELWFVYLPEHGRYAGEEDSPCLRCRDRVLTIVKGLDVPVVDIAKPFEEHADPLSMFTFRLLGHYNEDGHHLMAQAVERRLGQRRSASENDPR